MTNTTNNNGFLPDDYEAPKGESKYTRFEEGDTKVRILTSPLLGWVYFTEDNKPKRFLFKEKPESTPGIKKTGKLKEFWALVVWNFKEERLQIMELTQVSIKGAIDKLCNNEEWGTPLDYNITIHRKGEGLDTEYNVIPSPKSKLDESIAQEFALSNIDLNKLITNDDPFIS